MIERTIDIHAETVVTLAEAAKRLPPRGRGKRPHVATLYRWAQKGCRGIRLETIRIGGSLCTSLEALQRFCDRLTQAQHGEVSVSPESLARRGPELKRAQQAADDIGI